MNLVLAHGFLGFQRRYGIHYFHGVKEYLAEALPRLHLKILETEVSPLARIHLRGAQLRGQILAAMEAGELDPAERVHLVAHSMGGLDARWCLSPANPENIAEKVASLSTISTPHRGSPVADFLTGGGRLSARAGARLGPYLDVGLGIVDLTTDGATRFNERFPDHPEVRYFSYAGKGRPGPRPTSLVLAPCHWIIAQTGAAANDGLVSVESAAWGESPEEPWPADHADEIGHDLNQGRNAKPAFDYLVRYRALVERLAPIS